MAGWMGEEAGDIISASSLGVGRERQAKCGGEIVAGGRTGGELDEYYTAETDSGQRPRPENNTTVCMHLNADLAPHRPSRVM